MAPAPPPYITLKESLAVIASGQLFSISFVTANKSTGKGGQWRHYTNCSCSQAVRAKESPVPAGATAKEVKHLTKNPHFFQNSTRNIKLPDGSIKQAHIRLIRRINGRVVL